MGIGARHHRLLAGRAIVLPEVNLGFFADAGGVFRLPKRLPRALAMELLLTGWRMDAEEAARRGLVNSVVAPDQVMTAAREFASRIEAAAPLAVRAAKAIVTATDLWGRVSVPRIFRPSTTTLRLIRAMNPRMGLVLHNWEQELGNDAGQDLLQRAKCSNPGLNALATHDARISGGHRSSGARPACLHQAAW